ncbi:aminotransferase class III-fold pyridoxal phosphate-dependent enzyme [bacterium]|nr:aminotransferase class III-fold pyridoxal phosphate-dependent enzyme [bacterium]
MPQNSHLVDTYPQYPFEITSGKGPYVFDGEGNRYLDLYGGHAVCALGHCEPRIAARIAAQAEKLFFYSNLTKLRIRDEAAEALIRFADSSLHSVFFCNSGAEANENALKLAVQTTGRSKLVAFSGGWHGRTTMAAAVTDDPRWHAKTPGWTGEVLFLTPSNKEQLSRIDTSCAAVIIEPIQSIGGAREISDDFLAALRERTKDTGTLLIFDEVQTGVGRTAVPYVSGHGLNIRRHIEGVREQVAADMVTSAKSLANGFPVGALLMSDELARTICFGDLGSTFGGGPLAAAAVKETIDIIQEQHLMERVLQTEDRIRQIVAEVPFLKEVRGRGCLLGIQVALSQSDLVKLIGEEGFTTQISNSSAKVLVQKLREQHILAGVSGVSDVMRLLPPYIITEEHAEILRVALHAIGEELA